MGHRVFQIDLEVNSIEVHGKGEFNNEDYDPQVIVSKEEFDGGSWSSCTRSRFTNPANKSRNSTTKATKKSEIVKTDGNNADVKNLKPPSSFSHFLENRKIYYLYWPEVLI